MSSTNLTFVEAEEIYFSLKMGISDQNDLLKIAQIMNNSDIYKFQNSKIQEYFNEKIVPFFKKNYNTLLKTQKSLKLPKKFEDLVNMDLKEYCFEIIEKNHEKSKFQDWAGLRILFKMLKEKKDPKILGPIFFNILQIVPNQEEYLLFLFYTLTKNEFNENYLLDFISNFNNNINDKELYNDKILEFKFNTQTQIINNMIEYSSINKIILKIVDIFKINPSLVQLQVEETSEKFTFDELNHYLFKLLKLFHYININIIEIENKSTKFKENFEQIDKILTKWHSNIEEICLSKKFPELTSEGNFQSLINELKNFNNSQKSFNKIIPLQDIIKFEKNNKLININYLFFGELFLKYCFLKYNQSFIKDRKKNLVKINNMGNGMKDENIKNQNKEMLKSSYLQGNQTNYSNNGEIKGTQMNELNRVNQDSVINQNNEPKDNGKLQNEVSHLLMKIGKNEINNIFLLQKNIEQLEKSLEDENNINNFNLSYYLLFIYFLHYFPNNSLKTEIIKSFHLPNYKYLLDNLPIERIETLIQRIKKVILKTDYEIETRNKWSILNVFRNLKMNKQILYDDLIIGMIDYISDKSYYYKWINLLIFCLIEFEKCSERLIGFILRLFLRNINWNQDAIHSIENKLKQLITKNIRINEQYLFDLIPKMESYSKFPELLSLILLYVAKSYYSSLTAQRYLDIKEKINKMTLGKDNAKIRFSFYYLRIQMKKLKLEHIKKMSYQYDKYSITKCILSYIYLFLSWKTINKIQYSKTKLGQFFMALQEQGQKVYLEKYFETLFNYSNNCREVVNSLISSDDLIYKIMYFNSQYENLHYFSQKIFIIKNESRKNIKIVNDPFHLKGIAYNTNFGVIAYAKYLGEKHFLTPFRYNISNDFYGIYKKRGSNKTKIPNICEISNSNIFSPFVIELFKLNKLNCIEHSNELINFWENENNETYRKEFIKLIENFLKNNSNIPAQLNNECKRILLFLRETN